jgi:hypothetical protein
MLHFHLAPLHIDFNKTINAGGIIKMYRENIVNQPRGRKLVEVTELFGEALLPFALREYLA